MTSLAKLRLFALAGGGWLGLGLGSGAGLAVAQAPPNDAWTRFSVLKKDEFYYGYKDARGRVRIPAKFTGLTNARRFNHLMAVSEGEPDRSYYLLKNGRQVGRDSVYTFDFQFDCESEGKILFRDPRRNRVGFFDARGKVIIPAVYNYATPFHNGLSVALIGARQTCGDTATAADTVHCEHRSWAGGRLVLLNERNEILVDNFSPPTTGSGSGHLNWYSLRVNAPRVDPATTVTFPTGRSDRYTLTDYDKEFANWLYDKFLPAIRSGGAARVQALCFGELALAARPFRGWPHFSRAVFVGRYYRSVLRPKLAGLRRGAPTVSIYAESLNSLIFPGRNFQQFLTDCGEHFEEKYPAFTVLLSYPARPRAATPAHQEHYQFIRTAGGYRLFCVAL